MKKRLIELDFIRGVAILAVMAYHYIDKPSVPSSARWITVVSGSGWAGVDLFFVLSGYLVAGLLFSEYERTDNIRFGRFLARRALKIWPSYYFYLLFQVIVRRHPISTFLVQNLSNLQNYLGTSLEHTWSLAVEEHFYVFLVIMLLIWRVDRLPSIWIFKVCLTACLAILILRVTLVLMGHTTGIVAYTHTRLDSMLFGVILAWISFFNQPFFQKLLKAKYTLLTVTALACVFALIVPKPSPAMLTIGFTVLYLGAGAFILLVSGHAGRVKGWIPFKVVAWLGFYSYTIYLWHLSVREPIRNILGRLRMGSVYWWLGPILDSVAAVAIAVIASRALEWPILKMRDKLMPEKQIRAVAPELAG